MKAKNGRTCAVCKGPIPIQRRRGAIFCSKACCLTNVKRVQRAATRAPRRGRTCRLCKRPISIEKINGAVFCEVRCRRAYDALVDYLRCSRGVQPARAANCAD
jgi:hypothetical protein